MSSRKHILIVEDDEDMRDYLDELLRSDYQTTQAVHGEDALRLLEGGTFDLVLSDLAMPRMDGLQLLQALRRSSRFETLPFLMVTARSEKEYVLDSLRQGVDSYITKPFDSEELLARIGNLLNNYELRKQAFSGFATHSEKIIAIEEGESPDFRSKWLKQLESFVMRELDNSNLSVSYLAFNMATSERTLRNKIRLYTGLSPVEYILKCRMSKAHQLMEDETYSSISEVMHAVGIKSTSYFAKVFRAEFGKNPSDLIH